jgi:hypothetical protein
MFCNVLSLTPSIDKDSWRDIGFTEAELFQLKSEQRQQRTQYHLQNNNPDVERSEDIPITARSFRPKELVASIEKPIDAWLNSNGSLWALCLDSRRAKWHQSDFYWLYKHQMLLKQKVSI